MKPEAEGEHRYFNRFFRRDRPELLRNIGRGKDQIKKQGNYIHKALQNIGKRDGNAKQENQ